MDIAPKMNPVEEILNDLESLAELFKDYQRVTKSKQKLTIPLECLQRVVCDKLHNIEKLTKELH